MAQLLLILEKILLRARLIQYNLAQVYHTIALPKSVQIFRGKLLRRRFRFRERLLWERYQFKEDLQNLSIVRQTISLARKLLLWLLALFAVAILADAIVFEIFKSSQLNKIGELSFYASLGENLSPINEAISQLIGIYITAIATIFGLFFALYIVGFETTTQGYSRDVAQFINDERVEGLFFRWLLFTLFFNVFAVIRIWLIEVPAVVSFVIATVLTVISLLTILIYRTHNVLASRPESILKRVLIEFHQALAVVNSQKSPFYHSLALSAHAHNEVRKMSELTLKLYGDLLNNNDTATASTAPLAVAIMLSSYAEVKHHLRTENTRWFPQELEAMSRSDDVLHPVAVMFSLRGEGTPRQSRTDYRWLEKYLLQILDSISDRAKKYTESQSRETLFSGIITAYQRFLYGDYSTDRYGRHNVKEKGLFESQDFDTFDAGLKQLIDMWESIKESEGLILKYLDTLYWVGLVLIDGFNQEESERASQVLVSETGLVNRQGISAAAFSRFTYQIVEKWWNMLDAENQIEGRMVTPVEFVKQAVRNDLQSEEAKYIDLFFSRLLEHTMGLLRSMDSRKRLLGFKVLLAWLKRAFYRERTTLLERFTGIFMEEVAQDLLTVDIELVRENEFQSELDDILFLSLTKRSKSLFEKASLFRAVIYNSQVHISSTPQNVMPLAIALAKAGGLTFAYSELDQDSFWVEVYSKDILRLFNLEGLIAVFKQVTGGTTRYRYQTIQEESYYQHWFKIFEDQLRKLSIEYTKLGYSRIPRSQYQHPSSFIKRFSADDYPFLRTEDESIEGYIEWLEGHLINLIQTPHPNPKN